MISAESFELDTICKVIVTQVYAALGSRLTDEEVAELASQLASEVTLSLYLDAGKLPGEVAQAAGSVMDSFLRGKGITAVGDEWHWLN